MAQLITVLPFSPLGAPMQRKNCPIFHSCLLVRYSRWKTFTVTGPSCTASVSLAMEHDGIFADPAKRSRSKPATVKG